MDADYWNDWWAQVEYEEEQKRLAFEGEVQWKVQTLSEELQMDSQFVFTTLAECDFDYDSAKKLLVFRNDIYEKCKSLGNNMDESLESFLKGAYQDAYMMQSIMSEKDFSFYQEDPESPCFKEKESMSESLSDFDEELPF